MVRMLACVNGNQTILTKSCVMMRPGETRDEICVEPKRSGTEAKVEFSKSLV